MTSITAITIFQTHRVFGPNGRSVAQCLSIAIVMFFTTLAAIGQVPDDVTPAPPPLKIIPKSERTLLDAEKETKDRTILALKLMDARLLNAQAANDADDLEKTFAELGIFHAMMEETLDFLESKLRRDKKALDNFKRFELGLRKFTPRLELIRREMPLTHEGYLKSLLRQLRDARTKATEPLFGNSVLGSL